MDRNSMLPMYQQMKNYLVGKIESMEYQEGDRLPSERELSEKFQISRMTARNAILELVKEGYAYRDGARGTFVASKKVKRNLLSIAGFSEHMKALGIQDRRSEVVEFVTIEADARLASRMGVSLGTECHRIVRLRLGNGQPMAVEESYIPKNMAPTLAEHDFSRESLWEVLEKNFGHRPARTKASLEIVHFDQREIDLMGLGSRAVGFRVVNTNLDKNGEPVEFSVAYYREDMFVFEYEMIR